MLQVGLAIIQSCSIPLWVNSQIELMPAIDFHVVSQDCSTKNEMRSSLEFILAKQPEHQSSKHFWNYSGNTLGYRLSLSRAEPQEEHKKNTRNPHQQNHLVFFKNNIFSCAFAGSMRRSVAPAVAVEGGHAWVCA